MTVIAEDNLEQQFAAEFNTLTSLAQEKGFVLKDVPRDGNCLFSAVQLQLPIPGSNLEQGTLRQQLVAYFEDCGNLARVLQRTRKRIE